VRLFGWPAILTGGWGGCFCACTASKHYSEVATIAQQLSEAEKGLSEIDKKAELVSDINQKQESAEEDAEIDEAPLQSTWSPSPGGRWRATSPGVMSRGGGRATSPELQITSTYPETETLSTWPASPTPAEQPAAVVPDVSDTIWVRPHCV
jgi:hypothetical protein